METRVGDFTVRAVKIEPHFVEWHVIEVCGQDCETGEAVYMNDGEVTDIDGAELFASGKVRWDGCSNWDLMPDGCAKHFCDTEDMQAMADVLKECYRLTENLCEKWDA